MTLIGAAITGLRAELVVHTTNTTQHGACGACGAGDNTTTSEKLADMDCTAFPTTDPSGNFIDDVKYYGTPITKNLTDTAENSKLMVITLAWVLLVTAVILTSYFVIPPMYIRALKSMANATSITLPISMPLVKMHFWEGLISFIIIYTCLGLLAGQAKTNAPIWIVMVWLVLVLMINVMKNGMVKEAFPGNAGEAILNKYYGVNDGKNEFDTKPSRVYAILYHMFCFFPAFPLAWGVEILKKEKGTDTWYFPPPLQVWNTRGT